MTPSPAVPREPSRDALAAQMAAARARSLAAVAGNIAHELNNKFNAVLGLAALLRPLVRDDDERALLGDLQAGTKVGARMLAVLTRMLTSEPGERALVDADALLEDALVLVRKSMAMSGIDLEVTAAAGLPAVRAVTTEATQAILQGLLAVIAGQPRSMHVAVDAVAHAVAGGRERLCVRLRCEARGLAPEPLAQLAVVGSGESGLTRPGAGTSPSFEGLMGALLIQRRLGGDLQVECAADGLRIDYWWPAAASDAPRA